MSLKSYYSMSQKAERAQRANRNTPTARPEMDFCLPMSRFDIIMQLARAGASDEVFRRKIRKIDKATIEVARKLAAGTDCASVEATECRARMKQNIARQKEEIFRRFDRGQTNTQIRIDLGLPKSSVLFYRRRWQLEREEKARKEREAEKQAG